MSDRFAVTPQNVIYAYDPVEVRREGHKVSYTLEGGAAIFVDGKLIGNTKKREIWTPPWERAGPNRKARRNR